MMNSQLSCQLLRLVRIITKLIAIHTTPLPKNSVKLLSICLYNNYLDEDVTNKIVTINWQFSDSDLAMIDTKNVEWKTAEAQKKAEAEAARIAAEQAEAQRKAEEEAKRAAEAAAQQAAQQVQSVQHYSNNGSNGLTSSTSSGANTGTHVPSTAQSSDSVYYQNCDAVRATGKAPLYRGQPGYSAKLDRDKDGVACE